MNNLSSIDNHTWPFSPTLSSEPPVDVLIVSCQGEIHFAPADDTFLGVSQPFPVLGANIASIFESIISPAEKSKLMAFIADSKVGNFSFKCQSTENPSRSLSITGHSFPFSKEMTGWILTTQDVSIYQKLLDKISILENDIEIIRLTEKNMLNNMTASLIDTNVALRKEVRDRQSTLEELSVSEARFRNLTETTSDFIWEINNSGNYTYASPKSIKLLGIEPQELLGTPLFLFRKVASASEFIKNFELGGQPQHGFSKIEYHHTRPDGFEVTVESSGEPIFSKSNVFKGFRGIDRDVTERRIYETQLQQAKQAAESANLAKSEFLANMSHELRTPLHAILSFAKYGEKRIESANRKELFRFFSQINTSGERLLPLIDSLLDLAKLESGKTFYDFQNRDIMVDIRSVIHEITPLAEKKGVSFTFISSDVPTVAWFDQATIAQVIRNILANGVKFANENTCITISFTLHKDAEARNLLKTTISNFGVTIPSVELHTIFDKFVQSSKTKTGAGGTGLGLAISKHIVEDHGGAIWADHGTNGDSQFHFTLPVRRR